ERAHLRPRHVGAGAGPVGDDLPGAGREVGGPAAGAEDDPPARDHRPHLASVCLAGTAPSAPVRRGAANQALDPRGSHDHRIPDRRVAGRHPGDAPAADLGGGAGGTGRDPAVRLLGADGTILRLDHRPAAHRRLPGGLLLVERRVRVLRRPPAALGERPGGGAHGVPVHGPDVRGDRAPHGPFPPGPGLRGGHPGSDLRVDRDLRRRAGGDGAAVVAAVPPARRRPAPPGAPSGAAATRGGSAGDGVRRGGHRLARRTGGRFLVALGPDRPDGPGHRRLAGELRPRRLPLAGRELPHAPPPGGLGLRRAGVAAGVGPRPVPGGLRLGIGGRDRLPGDAGERARGRRRRCGGDPSGQSDEFALTHRTGTLESWRISRALEPRSSLPVVERERMPMTIIPASWLFTASSRSSTWRWPRTYSWVQWSMLSSWRRWRIRSIASALSRYSSMSSWSPPTMEWTTTNLPPRSFASRIPHSTAASPSGVLM